MRQKAAEALLLKMGITFNVYGRDEGTEKIFPFDIIPRIVSGNDWQQIESGLKQRIFALNEFIQDIYNEKKILKDKVVPEDLILTSRTYRTGMRGVHPAPGHLVPCDRHRPGAGPRWAFLRAGRQPALPLGRFLCAGKPPGAQTHLPPGLPGLPGATGGRLSRQTAGDAGLPGPGPGPIAHHRRADPRHLQQRLLRALLSLPANGGGTGGGPGPGGRRRLSSTCSPPRASSGWMSSTGASTTTSSIRKSSVPIPCWGSRASSESTRPAGSPWPTHRAPASPTTR